MLAEQCPAIIWGNSRQKPFLQLYFNRCQPAWKQYILAFRPSILAIAGKATPSGGNTMKRKASTSLVSVYLNGLCMAIWIVFAIVAFDSTYDLLFSSLRVITAILWAVAFFQSVLRFRKQAKNDASSS